MHRLGLVLFCLATTAALAQRADLSVTVHPPPEPDALDHHTVHYSIDVHNAGPDPAANVQLTFGGTERHATNCNPRLGTLQAKATRNVLCWVEPAREERRGTIAVRATSDTADPSPGNNEGRVDFDWIAGPNLQIELAPRNIDVGLPNDIVVNWRNINPIGGPSATIVLDIPKGFTFAGAPGRCSIAQSAVTCTIDGIPPPKKLWEWNAFPITLVADISLRGTNYAQLAATITSGIAEAARDDNADRHSVPINIAYFVTNTHDSGAGSLRQAIESANADSLAHFRKIDFRIPAPPASGYHTIAPETPLPAIARMASIDGSTQTRAFGDTNPDGPEIFIDGSKLAAGHGLHVGGASEVFAVAVGNFPGHGVLVDTRGGSFDHDVPRQVARCYVGVRADGITPAPNGRGVFIDRGVQGHVIRDNVISANRYSGIFLNGTATIVQDNIIGLDAKVAAPLGNGASGIYFGVPPLDPLGRRASFYTYIAGNYIAFNHDFGIAACTDCLLDIQPNAIFANWQMGIDLGLDGPSNAPTVTAATYDPATDTTTITVTNVKESYGGHNASVYFYASDAPHPSGHGDGQYYLGEIQGRSLTVQGDLRGKWVSVTSTRHEYCCFDTGSWGQNFATMSSELSNAVPVK